MTFFQLLDPMYWLIVGPTMLLAIIAQVWVRSAFSKWSRVPATRGLTGREVARQVLANGSVGDVRIEVSEGRLSDHYDPRGKVLRLSQSNYEGRSVAAAAIAAHEAGHALQHAHGYLPLHLRSLAVPAANIGSRLGLLLIILGLFIPLTAFGQTYLLAKIGIVLYAAVVLFTLITLPVEFDASFRARRVLLDTGIITDSREARGVNAVLMAAAMTYVAAAVQAIATLLYYVMLVSGRRN